MEYSLNSEILFLAEEFNNKYDLKGRTKSFSYKCFDLCHTLPNNYMSNHIKGQLFRCSTSVAANYRATCLAQTKAGFISKISIVIEEADESIYWLELLKDKNIIDSEILDFLLKESKELTSIFIKSRITAISKQKLN